MGSCPPRFNELLDSGTILELEYDNTPHWVVEIPAIQSPIYAEAIPDWIKVFPTPILFPPLETIK